MTTEKIIIDDKFKKPLYVFFFFGKNFSKFLNMYIN